jgi:hypothetical protein
LAKTVNECRAEWQAHKDIFQPKGISVNDYVEECRGFPATTPETPATTNAAPAASVPAVVKPADVAVAAPVAPSHPSTAAAKPKKPEDTHRIVSRDEFKSKPPPQVDRSARNRNAQLDAVASPPPAPSIGGPSCETRHSGTIIHSARCGF